MNDGDHAWIRREMTKLQIEELADYVIGLCDECTSHDELCERVTATLESATEASVSGFVDALGGRWDLCHNGGAEQQSGE
jgi:hypothetical protein